MEFTQENYTRHYIVQALFLLMGEYEYQKITISDVAKKAGVGRATFYRYFKSKEDIIRYYFNSTRQNFVFSQHLYPRCKQDYIEISTDVFTLFLKNKEWLKLLRRAHLEYIYLDFLNDNFLKTFESDYPESKPYAPYLYAGMLYNVSFAWLDNDCRESPHTLAESVVGAIYFE